jgi:hypothetical protein
MSAIAGFVSPGNNPPSDYMSSRFAWNGKREKPDSGQSIAHPLQALLHLLGDLGYLGVVDQLQDGLRVDEIDADLAVAQLPHHDIALDSYVYLLWPAGVLPAVMTRGVGRATYAPVYKRGQRSMGMTLVLVLVLVAAASGTDTLVVVVATGLGQVSIGVGIHPGQAPEEGDQVPDFLVRVRAPPCRHPGHPDAVLDDPESLGRVQDRLSRSRPQGSGRQTRPLQRS